MIPATGHTEITDAPIAATCTTAGLTAGAHCSVCGTVLAEQEPIPAAGHSFLRDTTRDSARTCTADGLTAYTCNRCGAHADQAEAATGHRWDAGIVTTEATALAEGVLTFTCAACAATKTEAIAKLPVAFTDGDLAKLDAEGDILLQSGVTPATLLAQATAGAVLQNDDGSPLAEGKAPGSGTRLVLADGTTFTLLVRGDTDSDGLVTAADARIILRASVGLETIQ